MSDGEQIEVDSTTGAMKGRNTQRGSLFPPRAFLEIANHYGVGSLKYDDNNWRRGYAWSWSYDALLRHLMQFWSGEDYDEATGSKHIIAVAWHALALATFMDEHPELDDRWKNDRDQPTDREDGDYKAGAPGELLGWLRPDQVTDLDSPS